MKSLKRILSVTVLALICVLHAPPAGAARDKPNFIIIFTDDQGYNDLGCFGSEKIRTPRIDQLAKEGLVLTSLYAQTVCGPSRGALMTGRYPARIGHRGGWVTPGSEITIAELLRDAGYSTACIGKWDMSGRRYQAGMVPNDQGFDYYFGTLGANDGGRVTFYRNRDELHTTSDMSSLTALYTGEAIRFITEKKDRPFFLYLAHTMAHVMIDASKRFKGTSAGDLYGDVIEEIDWNVGRLLDTVRELGLNDNTYIFYFSDNGPWSGREEIYRKAHGGHLATGSAKPLRSGKGSAYEGGFRVPCILWAPGKIPAGRVSDQIVSTLDFLPTLAALAGTRPPADRTLDGYDQTAFVAGRSETSARNEFCYHYNGELHAVRRGKWKLVLPGVKLLARYTGDPPVTVPELYDLEKDISETTNLAAQFPEVLRDLQEMAGKALNNPDPQPTK